MYPILVKRLIENCYLLVPYANIAHIPIPNNWLWTPNVVEVSHLRWQQWDRWVALMGPLSIQSLDNAATEVTLKGIDEAGLTPLIHAPYPFLHRLSKSAAKIQSRVNL